MKVLFRAMLWVILGLFLLQAIGSAIQGIHGYYETHTEGAVIFIVAALVVICVFVYYLGPKKTEG